MFIDKISRSLVQCLLLLVAMHACHASDFTRPEPPGGGPTLVHCALNVVDVDDVNDADQNFTIHLYTFYRWKDVRLEHQSEEAATMQLKDIWHPRLSYLNMQRTWSGSPEMVHVSPEGMVELRQQFWGNFSQPLKLKDFPLDRQELRIPVMARGYTEDEVLLAQDPDLGSHVTDNYSVADWEVTSYRAEISRRELITGYSPQLFELVIEVDRHANHYLIKVIIPLLLIVAMSWVVFWIDPAESGSQLSVSVTIFLTMIAYHIALASKLPEIPYLTRIDVFLFSTTVLVFLSMLEVLITSRLVYQGKVSRARWVDRMARFVFPGATAFVAWYAFYIL